MFTYYIVYFNLLSWQLPKFTLLKKVSNDQIETFGVSSCLSVFWMGCYGNSNDCLNSMMLLRNQKKYCISIINTLLKMFPADLFETCPYVGLCGSVRCASDAHLNGDQEVSGLIPARSSNILSWRLIMKYFLGSFSPIHLFK